MKYCKKCEQDKPVSEFHKGASMCKPCRNAYYKTWRANNAETVAEGKRRYHRENAEKIQAKVVKWQKANPARVRGYSQRRHAAHRDEESDYQLRRRYGISRMEYVVMLAHQDGRCAICAKPQGEDSKRHHVDHDHDTGLIRGLLCNGCNGLLDRQDVERTHEMEQYLDLPPAQEVLGALQVPGW